MDRKTQTRAILDHMEQGYHITPLSAFSMFKCLRLSGRIYDLKQAGHAIKTESVVLPGGKRVARYSLIK